MSDKPAFPQTIDDMGTIRSLTAGMTLREYAAIHAMQGILASPKLNIKMAFSVVAEDSVKYADALLKQLEVEAKP